MPHRVAFLGFSEFERKALASYFRLAHNRSPSYEQVPTLTDADYLVADADHGPSVQLVEVIERMAETVFIGAHQPAGSRAWMMRPIDALHVMRELDGLVAQAMAARRASVAPAAGAEGVAGAQTTVIQLQRRRKTDAPRGQAPLLGDLPFSAPAPEALDPLTLRDVSTAVDAGPPALALPDAGRFAPEDALAAHEPPLPMTLPPEGAHAEADSKPGLFGLSPPAAPEAVGAAAPLSFPPLLPLPPLPDVPAVPAEPALAVMPVVPPPPPAPAPAAAARAAQPAKPPKPPKQPKAALLPGTPRVLLVDDSAIATRFLEVHLAPWRCEVDRATHSQGALALLAQHSYDIVFLDIELGPASELDGLALCQRIKQAPALMNALVVVVSAHHSELDRVRGALAGCDAYLAKPLDVSELKRLMQRQGLQAAAGVGTGSTPA